MDERPVTETIEDETGDGLLLNDPLVMSMYQSSPQSSPDSSPVRTGDQLPEQSLSDREFEQMEAAAAQVSEVRDFSDFGHPNLQPEYVIDSDDPFSTPAKVTVAAKSSDEEEYEVISQSADVSNLLSLSPEHSFAADTTIIDPPVEQETHVVTDLLPDSLPPPPPPPLTPEVSQTTMSQTAAESSSREPAEGAPDSQTGASHASAPSDDEDSDDEDKNQAPRDDQSEARLPSSSSSESEPEADPVSAVVPVQSAAPKKTPVEETSLSSQSQPVLSLGLEKIPVQMASADSSTSSCCPYTSGSWLTGEGLHPGVAELVFWKDVRKSGIAFGTGLVVLLALACCSVISVIAYTGLTVLTGTLSFRVYKNILQAVQKTNDGHPFRELLDVEITPPNERVHQMVDVVLKHVNAVLRKLRSVFLVEDIIDSLKFVVLFWCLTYIGAWFNGLTLVILMYLSAFSLPVVYQMHKQQIDQAFEMALKQVHDVVATVKSKIPFPVAKDKKQE